MCTWLALICMPQGICPGSHKGIEPYPATVSANAREAPPFKMSTGSHGREVRSSTGIVAFT